MKTVLRNVIVSALSILLLPGASYEDRQPSAPEPLLLVIEQPDKETEPSPQPEQTVVRLLVGQETRELPLEEYLVGVVLSEIPAGFSLEAFKAQAVAARTFALRRLAEPKHADCDLCADAACCQAWTSPEALREKFGADYESTRKKGADAVRDTAGEALYYDGTLIDAVYYSCSGGKTEDALAVWGSEVPYLQSVPSPGEQDAPRNFAEVCMEADELAAKLREARPDCDFSASPECWFEKSERTRGGGVASAVIGGQTFTGTELRRLLGLNSTDFTVCVSDGSVTFSTRGFGHRVGMSQYGAEAMAKQGFDYRTILRYYYRGTEIKKLPGEDSGENG